MSGILNAAQEIASGYKNAASDHLSTGWVLSVLRRHLGCSDDKELEAIADVKIRRPIFKHQVLGISALAPAQEAIAKALNMEAFVTKRFGYLLDAGKKPLKKLGRTKFRKPKRLSRSKRSR